MEIAKIMMGVKEFAQASGISEKQVRQLCHIEGFPAMNNGNKILIHYRKAGDWLADYAEKCLLS